MSDRRQEHRCVSCRFWHGPYTQECHRHSPVHVPTEFSALALALSRTDPEAEEMINQCHRGEWPSTRPEDWCGEWEAAAE